MAMQLSQFEQLPLDPGRVVFLGDSITAGGNWSEWFPDLPALNRGVDGDSVAGVHARLGTAIADPLAVSLLIGTNDLSGLGESRRVERIAEQTRALVAAIKGRAPEATFLLNSVMPRTRWMARTIQDLNRRYVDIAAEAGVTYVDLWPVLADDDGALEGRIHPRPHPPDRRGLRGMGPRAAPAPRPLCAGTRRRMESRSHRALIGLPRASGCVRSTSRWLAEPGHTFFGRSLNGIERSSISSRGRSSTRSARMLRWISSVPP